MPIRLTGYSDRLLDTIYDAATDEPLWVSALTQMADATGSHGGILFGQSYAAAAVYFDHNGRMSEECNTAYKARHLQNPWNAGMQSRAVGEIVLSDELIPIAELRRTLFYEEVLRPQDDAVHNSMVALAARDDFRVAFNLCRTARHGPLDGAGQAWLRGLVPHMRRSIGLGHRIGEYRALQEGQYRVLDRLSGGIILLDRRARVIYANAAARALDTVQGPLRLRGASVTATSRPHALRLEAAVRAALGGVPSASVSLPRTGDGKPVTALVVSVRGRDVGRFADLHMTDAAVMLFVADPENRTGVPAEWIIDAFGLTRAEARVALAASSGLTVHEAAAQLGLSANTIKTHLRRVFAKTGSTRQTELTRLITALAQIRAPLPDE